MKNGDFSSCIAVIAVALGRISKAKDDSLPLDSRLLKIDQQAHCPAGRSQIVETLGRVFVGKARW